MQLEMRLQAAVFPKGTVHHRNDTVDLTSTPRAVQRSSLDTRTAFERLVQWRYGRLGSTGRGSSGADIALLATDRRSSEDAVLEEYCAFAKSTVDWNDVQSVSDVGGVAIGVC